MFSLYLRYWDPNSLPFAFGTNTARKNEISLRMLRLHIARQCRSVLSCLSRFNGLKQQVLKKKEYANYRSWRETTTQRRIKRRGNSSSREFFTHTCQVMTKVHTYFELIIHRSIVLQILVSYILRRECRKSRKKYHRIMYFIIHMPYYFLSTDLYMNVQ